ncbi:hypothetical protein OI18_20190 [Flavihumibacter solisilvae]|uniref:Cytosine-specific methyltransferase n=1 Tax=Flavihumibacter solisilvae TaxID=1349421 RepID=A0A0C1KZ08_9BACT|nr:hypothetical protein OI18_20190 [Flavihumibacter solisilvae]
MTHIELFAGCGGMSLGLKAAGFELYFANELSPMAAETLAYNLFNESLANLAQENKPPRKVLWLKSNYQIDSLKERLRENPFDFSKGMVSDIDGQVDLKEKLLIGNIDHLLKFLKKHPHLSYKLKKQNVDLLSGGPPCQSFSVAGKREKENQKNRLPLSFAKFAGLIQPKVVLLENVKGITTPFTTSDGMKHYAWLEVAKTFSLQGFIPVCVMLNSKYFGIPQNRPRFILTCLRLDIFRKVKLLFKSDDEIVSILNESERFYQKVNDNRNKLDSITTCDLPLYDIEEDHHLFNGKLFPRIVSNEDNFITAFEAIDDISNTGKEYLLDSMYGEYPSYLNKLFKSSRNGSFGLTNHEARNHKFQVKARFRLLQVFNKLNGSRQDAIKAISSNGVVDKKLLQIFDRIKNESLLLDSESNDKFGQIEDIQSFKEYIKKIRSKKHSQRALKKDEPAPSQMTIPDDLCHYSKRELRTLTVREMARFQSFPDWFVFRSKVTTGGKLRSFEVPQYTQVGNAVPPLLAYTIGITIRDILTRIKRID